MDYLTEKRFSFVSASFPEDTFGVVSFTGTEGISRCYRFDITLVSDNFAIDLAKVVKRPATLTFHLADGGRMDYHGLVLRFEQLHEAGDVTFYRAYLAPKLHLLSFTRHNQILIGETVEDVVTECLKDGGLTTQDFEFRLEGTYDPLDYVCQYAESHFNFISRWLEHMGIYYFFEQTDQGEKVIFTDTKVAHRPLPQGDAVLYSPPSGLEADHMEETVTTFSCAYGLTPASVMVKDYNYRRPTLDVTGYAEVDEEGRGQVYSYGDHIRDSEQGDRLAKIMAESILCKREVFEGKGSVPFISPGFIFTLRNHYRESFNQTYLTTDINHDGNQRGFLITGLSGAEGDSEVYYRNSFHAIPSSVQFRSERTAVKSRLSGVVPAKVDAEGSGQYAEVDERGRYKVILPFDVSGKKGGKASKWVRMATPYSGADHGMHFPLHKGSEVLIAFLNGDADRPVIVGAIPNPDNPSCINTENQTMSLIHTAGGNKIAIEDREGSERILLHSPNQGSYVRIGAPGDPGSQGSGNSTVAPTGGSGNSTVTPPAETGSSPEAPSFGLNWYTSGTLQVQATVKNEVVIGESSSVVGGADSSIVVGLALNTHVAESLDLNAGGKIEIGSTHTHFTTEHNVIHDLQTKLLDTQIELSRVKGSLGAVVSEVIDNHAKIANVEASLGQMKTSITEEYTTAIVESTSALGTAISAIGTAQKAVAEETNSVAEQVSTLASQVQTIGQKTNAVLDLQQTIGSELDLITDFIATVATKVETVGEHTETVGLKTVQ